MIVTRRFTKARLIKIKKVGHAGTLDPLATGLLILCTGKFTKKINEYMAQEKEYTGTFTIGATTATYDLESEPGNFKPFENITEQDIKNAVKLFIGEISQVPPAHSAIKVDGKRVYELARQGKEVILASRKITIREFEITKTVPGIPSGELPIIHFRVVCTTGTYIRSLAYDFGNALGCGAYLSSLCRTRIGEFKLNEAVTIKEFEEKTQRQHGKQSRQPDSFLLQQHDNRIYQGHGAQGEFLALVDVVLDEDAAGSIRGGFQRKRGIEGDDPRHNHQQRAGDQKCYEYPHAARRAFEMIEQHRQHQQFCRRSNRVEARGP